MAHGRVRVRGQERPHTTQRPQPLLKDARYRESRTQEPSASLSAYKRNPYAYRRGAPPSGNRFSILAELDPHPQQTKWAFDFVQSPDLATRRRGTKRGVGGRHPKPNNNSSLQQEDSRRNDRESATGRVDANITPLGSESHDSVQPPGYMPQTKLSEREFTFSADSFKHDLFPQCPPQCHDPPQTLLDLPEESNSSELAQRLQCFKQYPSNPGKVLLGIEDATPATNRKESRFFRSSGSISTPEKVTQHPASTPMYPPNTPDSVIRTLATPPPALEAATSAAHRALNIRSLLPIPPVTANKRSLPTSGISPRPGIIKPQSTAKSGPSTAIALSPAVPKLPSLLSPPSVISDTSSISHPTCGTASVTQTIPELTPLKSPVIQTGNAVAASKGVNSPSTFQLPSTPSSIGPVRPIVSLPKPTQPSVSQVAPATLMGKMPPTPSPMNDSVQEELKQFLSMGHATPCWCSASMNKDCAFSNCTPSPPTSVAPLQLTNPRFSIPQRSFSDSSPDSGTSSSPASGLFTPTLTPSDSEFSDLALYAEARGVDVNTTPISDARSEDDWAVVGGSSDTEFDNDSLISFCSDETILSIPRSESIQTSAAGQDDAEQEEAQEAHETPPLTPKSPDFCTISPPPQILSTPPQIYSPTEELQSLDRDQLQILIEKQLEKISLAISELPGAHPPPTAALATTPVEATVLRPPPASPAEEHSAQRSSSEAAGAVTASAVEWPSLQDAVKMKRTKKNRKGVSGGIGNAGPCSGVAAADGGPWFRKGTMRTGSLGKS